MFEISKDFTGGNIEVISANNNEVKLQRELRDTSDEWFYWAFCVKGAQGKTVKFDIGDDYLGPFGPAVSHDLENWQWLNKRDSDRCFTYTFSEDEKCVYFAHNMLYHPKRFADFAKKRNLKPQTIAKAKNGDDIPYVTFGTGDEYILLTARHHACESTGNYVLEGVLEELIKCLPNNLSVMCVPFVDYDGVVNGDQGKNRIPHDHNRDYGKNVPPIYNTVKFIRDFAGTHNIKYAFDFHSPWHRYNENDTVFIPMKNYRQIKDITKFSAIFEKENEKNTLKYFVKNNMLPDIKWNNSGSSCFGSYMGEMTDSVLSFTLETCYFGTENCVFNEKNALTLGHNFARALNKFEEKTCRITVAGDILWHEPLMHECDKEGMTGYRKPFLDALPTLLDTDFLIGNPETVFSASDTPTHERYCFNTPVTALEALKKSGFDLLTFANNHIMDRGTNGILGTISACKKENLEFIGITDEKSKADDIYVKNINGINVSFLNFTYGTNAFAHHNFFKNDEKYMVNMLEPEETTEYAIDLLQDLNIIEKNVKEIYCEERENEKTYLHRMESLIKEAKEKSDFVIMLLHTGGQYNTEPDEFSKLIAKRAVSAGAQCVLCNHPHIILPSEFINNVFVAYGYGNFQSYLDGSCEIDPSYNAAVKIHLQKGEKITARYSFVLYKNVISDEALSIKNTYDIFRKDEKNEKLEREILFYASRFGNKKYDKVQKEYFIN